jgi:DNA-directed RNA polymerase specialized sigma24 family protein
MGPPGRDLLADRLGGARRAAFVGREPQLAAFRAALAGTGDEPVVHFRHGPGGVGKSTLLRRFADEAVKAGRRVVQVDGARIDPTPAGFESVAGTPGAEPVVLLVDAFDRCSGWPSMAGWLRERYLPRLPLGSVVVLAGRRPPDPMWALDPAWARVLSVEALGDLSPAQARSLLASRGVEGPAVEPILAFAGGHPLALVLAAGSAGSAGSAESAGSTGPAELGAAWEPTRDVVSALLELVVGDAPSPAHRRALETGALVPFTTEGLLRAVVGERAPDAFAWLRDLPFVRSQPAGLAPHRLVRTLLSADLRWRDVPAFQEVHDRAAGHLLERIRTAPPAAAGAALRSLHGMLRPGPDRESGPADRTDASAHAYHADGLRASDRAHVLELAGAEGGPAAAAAIGYWLRRRPEAFRVYRRSVGGPAVAFTARLVLSEDDPAELTDLLRGDAADPVAAAALARARTAPLRGRETLLLTWPVGPPADRCPPALTDLMQLDVLEWWLTAPSPGWSMVALPASAPPWRAAALEHLDHWPTAAPVQVGGVSYQLHEHDWRAVPASAWLHGIGRRALFGAARPGASAGPPGAVLPRPEFDLAVRAALRGWPRLAGNPLLRSRLVAGDGLGPEAAEEVLRGLIRRAVEAVGDDPREAKFSRAVTATYLERRTSQEAAAERLALPFSTYRRHLHRGLQRVCDHLWRLET